jgi:hypothetical protein
MSSLPPFYNPESKEDAGIKLRAANYYLATELYDLTLPGYFSRHNEWIPRGDHLGNSARYARKKRNFWQNGLSETEIKKFQLYSQDYARFSVVELREEIEVLKRQTASE